MVEDDMDKTARILRRGDKPDFRKVLSELAKVTKGLESKEWTEAHEDMLDANVFTQTHWTMKELRDYYRRTTPNRKDDLDLLLYLKLKIYDLPRL